MLRNVALLAKSFSASSKFIEVKPYPWLDFLEKSSKKLAPILCKGLNSHLQGELGQKPSYIARGWTGRIRTCECWDQNPVPYRLATVQSSVILAQEDKTVEQRKATPERAAIFMMAYNLTASELSTQQTKYLHRTKSDKPLRCPP